MKGWTNASSIPKTVKSVERMILGGSSDSLDIHVFKEVSHSSTPLFVATCIEVIRKNVTKSTPHVLASLVLLGRLAILTSYIQQLAIPSYTDYWENLGKEEKMLLNHPLIEFLPQYIHQFQTAMYGIVSSGMIPIKCEIEFLDTNILYIATFHLLQTFKSSKWITLEECVTKLIPKAFYSRFDNLSRYLNRQVPEDVSYQVTSFSDDILRGAIKVRLIGEGEVDASDFDPHAWAVVKPGSQQRSSLSIIGFGLCGCAALILILVLVIVLVIVPSIRNSDDQSTGNSTDTSVATTVADVTTAILANVTGTTGQYTTAQQGTTGLNHTTTN